MSGNQIDQYKGIEEEYYEGLSRKKENRFTKSTIVGPRMFLWLLPHGDFVLCDRLDAFTTSGNFHQAHLIPVSPPPLN